MQICFWPSSPRSPEQSSIGALLGVLLLGSFAAAAQTLAHPGWAGSGLTAQAWWQSALIYRVQPQFFQDSNGDGIGDLKGLAQRLDYLQSIGVDAILLESHAEDPGFDDLLSDASRRHIRILVQLSEGTAGHPLTSQQEIDEARIWFRRGVAGVYLPAAVLHSIAARASSYDEIFLLHQLRLLADSFPGERIVIAGDAPIGDGRGPELVEGEVSAANWNAAAVRMGLSVASAPTAGQPMLRIEAPGPGVVNRAEVLGREKVMAAFLLSSRGALSIRYGQEIGLPASAQAMQWTPTNVTRPQVAAAPQAEVVHYGPYRPYVRPVPGTLVAQPSLPKVTVDPSSASPPVDPNTLPGFSTQSVAAQEFEPSVVNVAVEDTNQESLLNFYRRVLELHSGNATIQRGSVTFFNHDAEGVVAWLRRAPAGARTVASVVVLCNLTERPVTVSVDGDLANLHIRQGLLMPLLTSDHRDHLAQSTDRVTISAHSVYVGELYHH